jgi:hypothetical protein
MKRYLAPALVLSLLCAPAAFAQHPTQQPAPKNSPQTDSTIAALVGTWEGSVYSDHASDVALKMVFTKTPALGVVVSIMSNGTEHVDAPATELKVEGTSVTWKQGLMQTSCKGTATLIGGDLKGGFDCGMGGVTYLAKKK